jgi:hypothetical protein
MGKAVRGVLLAFLCTYSAEAVDPVSLGRLLLNYGRKVGANCLCT